jgi:hypothetical protein
LVNKSCLGISFYSPGVEAKGGLSDRIRIHIWMLAEATDNEPARSKNGMLRSWTDNVHRIQDLQSGGLRLSE